MREYAERYHGWHFSAGRESYGERRRIATGTLLTIKGEPTLCRNGLHASYRAIDALRYGSGPIVSRVVLTGKIILDTDKAVATRRKHKLVFDATDLLHRFAVWETGVALTQEREAGREPPAQVWAALDAKIGWLSGSLTAEKLNIASTATWSAVTWYNTWDAVRAVTWYSAWDAAKAAVEAAVGAVATSAQNQRLERALLYVMGRYR